MKRNLIKTDNYLLVVDDSDTRKGDWCYAILSKQTFENINPNLKDNDKKKIISHAPLNGAPYLDPVDVLPPTWRDGGEEDSVEQLAEEHAEHQFKGISDRTSMFECKNDFKSGYQEAREKYKFTEEDLRNAFYNGWLYRGEQEYQYPKAINEFIQSIQQHKLPIAFECETERVENNDVVFEDGSFNKPPYRYAPKTIINSEGRTEWVGKYIYE